MTHAVDSSRFNSVTAQHFKHSETSNLSTDSLLTLWSLLSACFSNPLNLFALRAVFCLCSLQCASNYESCEYGGGEASFWFIVHSSPALFSAFAHEALLLQSAKVRHTQWLTSRGLMCARSLWIWLTGSDDGSTAKATGWEKNLCEISSWVLHYLQAVLKPWNTEQQGKHRKWKNKEITT